APGLRSSGPGGGARRWAAPAGPAADRLAAFLLLPRDVSAADDIRARGGGVVARRAVAGLCDAGLSLASARRWFDRGAAHRLRGHRPPARLVSRWRTDRLRPLRRQDDGADAARPREERGDGAH